jgi:hypothetical protein
MGRNRDAQGQLDSASPLGGYVFEREDKRVVTRLEVGRQVPAQEKKVIASR